MRKHNICVRSEERRVGKEDRSLCDWSSDVCSSDLSMGGFLPFEHKGKVFVDLIYAKRNPFKRKQVLHAKYEMDANKDVTPETTDCREGKVKYKTRCGNTISV